MPPERTRTTAQATAEGLRVFVAGVSWHIQESVLRQDFEECGLVEDFFLLKDAQGNSRGRCFVTYRDKEGADAALAFNDTDYGGRKIFVKVAEEKTKTAEAKPKTAGTEQNAEAPQKDEAAASRKRHEKPDDPMEKPPGCTTLCFKNIGAATEADLRRFLEGTEIQSIRICMDRVTGEPRGIGFVDFLSPEEVDVAMRKNGKVMRTKEAGRLEVSMKYEAPKTRPRPEGCLSVAVKKLGPAATEADVRGLFKGLEKSISEVRLITDRPTGVCTGLAFVDFVDGEAVEVAVSRSGVKIGDAAVFVGYETKQQKKRETPVVEGRRRKEHAPLGLDKSTEAEQLKSGANGDSGDPQQVDITKKKVKKNLELNRTNTDGDELTESVTVRANDDKKKAKYKRRRLKDKVRKVEIKQSEGAGVEERVGHGIEKRKKKRKRVKIFNEDTIAEIGDGITADAQVAINPTKASSERSAKELFSANDGTGLAGNVIDSPSKRPKKRRKQND